MSEKRNVPRLRFKEFTDPWKNVTLGDIAILITKGTTPKQFIDGEITFVKIESLKGQNIEHGQCSFIDEATHLGELKRSILQEGDILFAIAGATVGKIGIVQKEILPANTNQALAIIRLAKKETGFFMLQVLTSRAMKNYIYKSISVGAQPNLSLKQIADFSFISPSLPEQQKIAEFLTAVDRRIELLQAKKEKLEAYKKGVMQKIFPSTGSGQVPELRFKADDGSEFPDWEERKLGELAKIVVGGTPSTSKEEYWGGKIGWIGSGELKDDFVSTPTKYITEAGLSNSSTYLMPPNTILLAMTGATLGKTGFLTFGCCGNQSVAGFLPNENFDSYFLFQTLQFEQNQILSFAGGAAQVGINKRNIENLRIGLPCVEEQKKIASFLRTLDEQKAFLNQQINLTQTWKKGLLQKMFV